jgi:DNA-directed RNA polymerase subunit M/transcription elongation factor TFIIS
MNFRFMARNIAVDWRQVSLIDIDRIARDMDIPALQQHIELVTFAKLDSLYDIDPLFVKLFQIAQYTLEYLLHSQVKSSLILSDFIQFQDFLKNSVCEEQKRVEKEKKKHLATMKEVAHLKEQISSLKKTNKQRRQMSTLSRRARVLKTFILVADQQRMMQVGSHSFYKCPVCPNRSFMNSTYLQGHLVRRHPEHVHYIGDAVAHTKVKLSNLTPCG